MPAADSIHEPLQVTFFPPLYHQRRIWILDHLRRERLTKILDIGCGDGALLTTLCQPAPWLANNFEDDDQELSALLCDVELNGHGDTPDLHATHIAGLDISASELGIAVQSTSPTAINPLYTRWEPLDVELWQGSVDAINPTFVDVECVVASELIEHLTDNVLVRVAPVVLGVYRPRVFLVTTPSYTFNRRWSPPGTTDPQGYRDPTGRTDRVFRHSDHKFEWTVDEFVGWCEGVARQWGYAVETATIGVPKERDPWGRDGDLGGATQVASFRRSDDRFSTAARAHRALAVRCPISEPHRLMARHRHEAHPRAGFPSDTKHIEDAMIVKFQQWGEVTLGVHELWFTDDLPVLCGGSIKTMLDAAEQNAVLEVQKVTGQRQEKWKVRFVGELTSCLPQQNIPSHIASEAGDVMCEDEELGYDEGDSSLDSGAHTVTSHDLASRCLETDWTQFNAGWATNSWVDTSRSAW